MCVKARRQVSTFSKHMEGSLVYCVYSDYLDEVTGTSKCQPSLLQNTDLSYICSLSIGAQHD